LNTKNFKDKKKKNEFLKKKYIQEYQNLSNSSSPNPSKKLVIYPQVYDLKFFQNEKEEREFIVEIFPDLIKLEKISNYDEQ
jgi:hypothetical protein